MLVYISTFVSPHTLPLGIALTAHYRRVVFINTAQLTQERRQLGYQVSDPRVEIRALSEYYIRSYEEMFETETLA